MKAISTENVKILIEDIVSSTKLVEYVDQFDYQSFQIKLNSMMQIIENHPNEWVKLLKLEDLEDELQFDYSCESARFRATIENHIDRKLSNSELIKIESWWVDHQKFLEALANPYLIKQYKIHYNTEIPSDFNTYISKVLKIVEEL